MAARADLEGTGGRAFREWAEMLDRTGSTPWSHESPRRRIVAAVNRLAPVNRETARAVDSARSMLEAVRAEEFADVFALYNDDPADDPAGAGTAPGAGFAAFGLGARTNDADGLVGAVEFPTIGGELREDIIDASLGMPRDLDGDGVIDALDHSGDYEVLPFRVRLDWSGATGARTLVVHTSMVAP